MLKYLSCIAAVIMAAPSTADTLAEYLDRNGSHAVLSLELPLPEIEVALNKKLKKQYTGVKNDPIGILRSDTLTWQARPSKVSVSRRNACMVAKNNTTGGAHLKGRMLFTNIDLETDIKVNSHVSICPKLNANWSISPNLTGQAEIEKAELYGISISKYLQSDLEKTVDAELKKLAKEWSSPSHLRDEIREFWKSMCNKPKGNGKLVVRPKAVAATQPTVRESGLRFSFVISGDVGHSVKANAPCPPLPKRIILLD